jgi:hypothetical protein
MVFCKSCQQPKQSSEFATSHIKTKKDGTQTGVCRPCNTQLHATSPTELALSVITRNHTQTFDGTLKAGLKLNA